MRPKPLTAARAETLALKALAWLAADEAAVGRFLELSGMTAADLRLAAGSRDLSIATLDFLVSNETLIENFCSDTATEPETLHYARHMLEGRGEEV